jgi:hypothetical protein
MFSPYYYKKHRVKVLLSFINRLWWRFMPGTEFKVRWPAGNIVVDHNDPRWQDMGGAVWVDFGFSADPNDHYRPELEQLIGKQGWDWDWCMKDGDIVENLLTIKFRRGKETLATYFGLKWC